MVEFKKISRQELIDRATFIVNKPLPADYVACDFSYESDKWRNTKYNYIEANPVCEQCLNEGNDNKSIDVHHITPLSQGGEPYDKNNLIALCKSCHRYIHGSGGIAVELDISKILNGSYSDKSNYTTKINIISESVILQSKAGDAVNLLRDKYTSDYNNIKVMNKSGQHLGYINNKDLRNRDLPLYLDYEADINASIQQVTTINGKLECSIEIYIDLKNVDWNMYDECRKIDNELGGIIRNAKNIEKTDIEKSINLYRKAIEIIIENDNKYVKFPISWRYGRYPINRLSLLLERHKRYKECIKEIESYEIYNDRVGLYKGEKERLEKRKEKIIKNKL